MKAGRLRGKLPESLGIAMRNGMRDGRRQSFEGAPPQRHLAQTGTASSLMTTKMPERDRGHAFGSMSASTLTGFISS
jgi:hypothetical protein